MITVIKKMITVIKNNDSDILSLNHHNQILYHCNQFLNKKITGQSITEYAVFITVVVMALLAMQIYLKRGIQGKIKDMTDQISPTLYSPNTTTSDYNTTRAREYSSVYSRGTSTTSITLDQTNRTGYDYVEPEAIY